MIRHGVNFSKRLFFRSVLVLLVSIGFWRGNPEIIAKASPIYQSNDIPRFEEESCFKVLDGAFPWHERIFALQSRFRCGYLTTWKDYDLQELGERSG